MLYKLGGEMNGREETDGGGDGWERANAVVGCFDEKWQKMNDERTLRGRKRDEKFMAHSALFCSLIIFSFFSSREEKNPFSEKKKNICVQRMGEKKIYVFFSVLWVEDTSESLVKKKVVSLLINLCAIAPNPLNEFEFRVYQQQPTIYESIFVYHNFFYGNSALCAAFIGPVWVTILTGGSKKNKIKYSDEEYFVLLR